MGKIFGSGSCEKQEEIRRPNAGHACGMERGMKPAAFENWTGKARAVKIEDELARRTPAPSAEFLT